MVHPANPPVRDLLCVMQAQRQMVRSWLHQLGLGVSTAEEEAFVLDNPLTNGG